MPACHIPTSDLTPDLVPSPDDPVACRAFALTFSGYTYVDGGPAELMDYLRGLPANEDGVWDQERITVDDVRADLFMEQRATRWNCQGSEDHEREGWGQFERYAVAHIRLLRHMLFGEPHPNGATMVFRTA